MDKIPTPEEFIKQKMYIVHKLSNKEQPIEIGDVIETSERLSELISEYTKQVVKYTLEQAAEKGKVEYQHPKSSEQWQSSSYYWNRGDYGDPAIETTVRPDKQSILSLEDQIIKDLKL